MTTESLWSRSREKWNPTPLQVRSMKTIVQGEGCRLFLYPGKGKTSVVLKAFDILKKKGFVDALLVLGPLRVITTSWPGQMEYWEDFKHLRYCTIHGEIQDCMDVDADVYLMNFEGLQSKEWCRKERGKKEWLIRPSESAMKFLQGKRFMLAVDESTKGGMKNSNSLRFKVLEKYLHLFTYRTIMTGTPKPSKGMEELFAQCYITDLGRDLGQFITHFRRQYMMPDQSGYGWDPLPGAFERVAEKIAPTTVQEAYEEAVPSQTVPIWIPFPKHLRATYEELRKEFLTIIDGETVVTPTVASSLNKLRQLAQGAYYMIGEDGERVAKDFHDLKVDALESLMDELDGDPLFCLTAFKFDVDKISKRVGYPVPYIGSGTSAAQGAAWCASFGAGSIPLLAGHPQSVAHGVDGLQRACKNVCWYGMPWSWEDYFQGNLRIVRQGSRADQVNIYQILMDCSIERALLASVTEKQLSEAEFLQLLRDRL